MTLLEKLKIALRLTTNAYDADLTGLIQAAELDLGIAGVEYQEIDALVERAIITYAKMHFFVLNDGEYDRLKKSYDEQKAQMSMATGYTDWGVLA